MLRAFFGRHKTASTWARSILHEAASALDLSTMTIYAPQQWSGYASLGDKVRAERPDMLFMSNLAQSDFDTLPPLRGLNVVRDPRDIVVSGYFSHLHSHPITRAEVTWTELIGHRKLLTELDFDAGLHREIDFSGIFLDPMSEWNYANPGVLELRGEDMIAEPHQYWSDVLRHLELVAPEGSGRERVRTAAFHWNLAARRDTPKVLAYPRRVLPRLPLHRLPSTYVDSALTRFSFTRLSKGRRPGQEDVTSHYRRGIPGDWRTHFNDEHVTFMRERYGDLVERLGYPD